MNLRKSSPPADKSHGTAKHSHSETHSFFQGLLRYGLALVSIAAGLLLYFILEAPFGSEFPTYITFYPFVMLTALLSGFGPGVFATILTLIAIDIWIFRPAGQLTLHITSPVNLVSFTLFALMGLFISLVAEIYRRNRTKAAAYDQEEALRETRKEKEFFADLLYNAEQPFVMGFLDGSITRFNGAFEALTGYTAEELQKIDRYTELTPHEWLDQEHRKLEELKATGKPVRFEKEYIRKDGSRVPVELLTHIGYEPSNSRAYYYAFITDLTERKKVEVNIQETNARLREHASEVQAANDAMQKSQMEALNLAKDADIARRQAEESNRNLLSEIAEREKTEERLRRAADELANVNRDLESFSYSISHDLRSPLGTIKGLVHFLTEDYADHLDEEGNDFLRRIDKNVGKMQQLIDDMLSLSRASKQEVKRRDVDISALVRDFSSELKMSDLQSEAEFIIQEKVHANADPALIHLALENLLRNAWKFTSGRGKKRIEFGTTTKDNQTVYFVRDNGVGFDQQFADKIFQPFKRVHSEKEFEGTGVGLSIVDRVIRRHGGKIWAEGEVGKGATFYFTIG